MTGFPGELKRLRYVRRSSHPLRLPFRMNDLVDRPKFPACIVMLQHWQNRAIFIGCQAGRAQPQPSMLTARQYLEP